MDSTAIKKSYKIDKNDVYHRIRANVVGTKLIQSNGFGNNYVEYYIKIETDYAKWTLQKRYDDMNKLNSKLIEKIPEIKNFFPPRRFFMSKDDIISERIKLFNKYFNYLFSEINIFLVDEILNFILIKSEILLLFIKKYSMFNVDENSEIFISLKKAYNILNDSEEKKDKAKERLRETREIHIPMINEILNNFENESNYYRSILKYENKRQVSFDWEEKPSQTPNLFVIREFLHNLSEKSENKMEIIKTFEDFFREGVKQIKFTSKEIKLLYIGEENNGEENEYFSKTSFLNSKKRKKISNDFKYHSSFEFFKPDDAHNSIDDIDFYSHKVNGLFYIIGNYSKNIILSIGCLDLLNRLIDPEYNAEADVYLNIFKSLKIEEYKALNLNKMIKSNIGGDKANIKAMKLLKYIFNDKSRDKYKRIIMEDDMVYKQYINYINKFFE